MQFETADKTALRLGCTVRAVQKWAKEGKIPHAHKVSRVWMIPCNAVRPEDSAGQVYESIPYPITGEYIPGRLLEYINSIEDGDDRALAMCQYNYFTCNPRESTILAEPYLDSKNRVHRQEAALFCVFANLCRGFMNKTLFAADIIRKELENCRNQKVDPQEHALSVFTALTVRLQLHLPVEDVPRIHGYMGRLPEGVRLVACYLMAYSRYLDKDYDRALGIVETALSISEKNHPVPMIYLCIIGAMSEISSMNIEGAHRFIDEAWKLASPDGLIMPFVEHYSLLQGLIEKYFKKDHPEDYSRIIAAAKMYNSSWYELYNQQNEKSIAQNLTHNEFTVAMLYSRNWRAKEIAAHMEISERTVMNYIAVIYDKLQINSKKDLKDFMLA